ncbi:DNA-binding protein [Shewanella amazonensis]|uniref:Uncharacterized protein n=1 Tax=Shewanella amazonensis (strain ATCC BAA-1098 / SB2B) TaxID=326297 RepID=A1S1U1_SHEAM|nr:conserved hypothetical protein [Shewanella amazonensis SB2B]
MSTLPQYLIAIDDTDDIGTRGTGDIAQQLGEILAADCGGVASPVTRHQLLVHPDIPYTSHNSAMCFALKGEISPQRLKQLASELLETESAAAADPGLAFLCLSSFASHAALVEFGVAAKRRVLTKDDAYQLADTLGVHLSEHGGTGQGVIGALAGLGLRLEGNDGRLKGHYDVGQGENELSLPVSALLAKTGVAAVIALDDTELAAEVPVLIRGKLKAVWRQGRSAILVSFRDGAWRNAGKQDLKEY